MRCLTAIKVKFHSKHVKYPWLLQEAQKEPQEMFNGRPSVNPTSSKLGRRSSESAAVTRCLTAIKVTFHSKHVKYLWLLQEAQKEMQRRSMEVPQERDISS